jgi:hypothetical protein
MHRYDPPPCSFGLLAVLLLPARGYAVRNAGSLRFLSVNRFSDVRAVGVNRVTGCC